MHIPSDLFELVDIPDGIDLPRITTSAAAGIAVAISGNILISLALNCQKLAHRRLESERKAVGQELRRPTPYRSTSAPTDHVPRRPAQPLSTTHSTPVAAVAILETEPLLESADSVHSGAHLSPNKPARRWLFSHRNPGRLADRSHLASTHALMPVDILPVNEEDYANHDASTQKEEAQNGKEGDYLKSKLWWLGFLLMNVGEIGNFISYAFAPASVVAPLGTFALIANCIFAPLMLGERFRKRDFLGIIIAIIGAVTVVLSANSSDTRLDPKGLLTAISQRPFQVYTIVYIVGIFILSGLSERSAGRRWVYIDVGLCALFGGFTVLSTKAVSTLLTLEWFEIFKEWITYPVIAVLILTGVGQIRYLNRALMRFDSKLVVPTQFVLFNLSAIVGSAILYGDFRQATFHQLVTFLYGCGATFAGVFIIAWAPTPAGDSDEFDADGNADEDAQERTIHDGEGEGLDDSSASPHRVKLGSLARRVRPTLIVSDGVASANATPILRSRQSIVSLYGFSPAQRVLLMNSSPRDEFARPNLQDLERDLPAASPERESLGRRRGVNFLDGAGMSPRPVGRYGATSATTSREHSRLGERVPERSASPSRSASASLA
ncbi:magnesium transporter NIPA-domain-containing protein [Trametes gibbosa]|nr:magnesium transporter NIPA-domain-containing protein [Trametes gibbosa]